jgi:hypothetical protein
MMKAKWILPLGVLFLLSLPTPGTASELCSDGTSAESDAFLAMLQSPQTAAESLPEQASLSIGASGRAVTLCTAQMCGFAFVACAQYCTFPCAEPIVLCTASACGVCNGCRCR